MTTTLAPYRLRIIERSARHAAHRGARLLDRVQPGWHRRVRIRPLDLGDGCNCVIGQLNHGSYEPEKVIGFDGWHDSSAHGFELPRAASRALPDDDENPDAVADEATAWSILTEAWRDEIRARR